MHVTKRAVLELVEKSVGADVETIARHFELSPPAASRHVLALLHDRLIEWSGAVLALTTRGRARLRYWRLDERPAEKTLRFK